MKAIAQTDIITINAYLIIEKGKEYEVEQIVRPGFYGAGTGYWHPDRIDGYKYDGSLYTADVFEPVNTVNQIKQQQ